jgi:CBS domain-containing protein
MADPLAVPLSTIMTADLTTVRGTDSVHEAMKVLVDGRVSGVPVENDSGHVIGVFSMTDAVRAYAQDHDPRAASFYDAGALLHIIHRPMEPVDATVASVMCEKLVSLPSTATVRDAARVMARELVHRVLVVDDGKLLGVVSSLDVCGTIGSVVFGA